MPDLELVSMVARPYAYVSRICSLPQLAGSLASSFEKLFGSLAASMVVPEGPPLVHYREMDEDRILFDAGFPISEDQFRTLRGSGLGLGATAAGEAIKALHVGSAEQLADTYWAVLDAIHARGLQANGDMWETYLSPPGTPQSETTTELLWPVRSSA